MIETNYKNRGKKQEKFKYIGESNRSGYVRGCEHYDQFMRLDSTFVADRLTL